ncbi:MAG: sugar transferase [bacterium]
MKNNSSLAYNVCLVIGDALAITLAFTIAYVLRVSLSTVPISAEVASRNYISILVSLLPFWILIFALLGLYNAKVYDNRFSEIGRLAVGTFVGILFVISYSYITNTAIFPARLVTLYAFGLALVLVFLFRTIARGIRRELFRFNIGINNVLIVGNTPVTSELATRLSNTTVTGYKVIGIVGGNKDKYLKLGCKVYSDFKTAKQSLSSKKLNTIIQAELFADYDQNDEILTYAQENHIAYRFVPGNGELFVGNIEVDLFQSVPVIAVHQTALIGWGRVVKRLTDILLGGILLLLVSPIIIVLAVLVKITSKGPVFFRQTRLTRFNHKFTVFKFRSHNLKYSGLSPEEAFTKMGKPELIKKYRDNGDQLPEDPRLTAMGRFMRRTSLDELPQLFNVVRGDISLVGPRALIPEELEVYKKRHAILSVKSGMTGLAQVSGRRDISFEERRKLDLYYVQNWSFWNDIVILIKTVWIVVFHKGAV